MLVRKEKKRIDFILPTDQTMKMRFRNSEFSVLGGVGKGPAKIRAGDWQPYLRAMPHAEFHSGSSCL